MTLAIGMVGLAHDDVRHRLLRAGVRILACDPECRAASRMEEGIEARADAAGVARSLAAPRVAWIELATGFATELAIADVWPEFAEGDVIVSAGHGDAADARRRAAALASARIHFVDCVVHRDPALSLRLGGHDAAIAVLTPYLDIAAGRAAWTHGGQSGASYHCGMDERKTAGNASP